jgi:hypothetical protein
MVAISERIIARNFEGKRSELPDDGEADPPGCSREVERVVLNALSISRLPHFFADNRGLRIVI